MLCCLDVQYFEDYAQAAAVVFDTWDAEEPVNTYLKQLGEVAAYEAGAFYQRELKPLLAVVGLISEDIDVYIIDAYCYLSAEQKPGLGAYMHEVIKKPMIGVAKNQFKETDHASEVLRGESAKPLYVTSIDYDQQQAAVDIKHMHGAFRIPTLLKAVDALARTSH